MSSLERLMVVDDEDEAHEHEAPSFLVDHDEDRDSLGALGSPETERARDTVGSVHYTSFSDHVASQRRHPSRSGAHLGGLFATADGSIFAGDHPVVIRVTNWSMQLGRFTRRFLLPHPFVALLLFYLGNFSWEFLRLGRNAEDCLDSKDAVMVGVSTSIILWNVWLTIMAIITCWFHPGSQALLRREFTRVEGMIFITFIALFVIRSIDWLSIQFQLHNYTTQGTQGTTLAPTTQTPSSSSPPTTTNAAVDDLEEEEESEGWPSGAKVTLTFFTFLALFLWVRIFAHAYRQTVVLREKAKTQEPPAKALPPSLPTTAPLPPSVLPEAKPFGLEPGLTTFPHDTSSVASSHMTENGDWRLDSARGDTVPFAASANPVQPTPDPLAGPLSPYAFHTFIPGVSGTMTLDQLNVLTIGHLFFWCVMAMLDVAVAASCVSTTPRNVLTSVAMDAVIYGIWELYAHAHPSSMTHGDLRHMKVRWDHMKVRWDVWCAGGNRGWGGGGVWVMLVGARDGRHVHSTRWTSIAFARVMWYERMTSP